MSSMALGIIFFALLGLVFGSFGNVLIYRIHTQRPITGRSACPSCHKTLSWFELFPILSYLALRGRCRRCHHAIGITYPLVEFGSANFFVFAYALHYPDMLAAVVGAFILYFLFLACIYDAAYQKIPDVFTICIALLAIVSVVTTGTYDTALAGAAVMLVWFGGQWLVSRGKAVGTGDIFLAVALGLWLGLRYALMTILISYMAGAIILGILLVAKRIRAKQQRIAYVPFLAIGVLLTLLGVGDAYMKVIGF